MSGYGQPGYGAPQGGYGAYPPQQGGFPPQQGGYPPQQGGYPPQQGGYPPQQGGYPPQGGYGAPSPYGSQGSFGAPPPGGYGAPQGGYGAPPPGGYGAPPPGVYGAPQGGYGAPAPYGSQGGFGAPPPGGYGVPAATSVSITTPVVTGPVVSTTVTTASIPIVFMPIFAYPPSDPKEDAHKLRKAMKGLGTDDSTLIHIMTHRSKLQLLTISEVYHKEHKHSLEKDIKGDTSGHYCELLIELAKPMTYLKADALKHATRGLGTRERILIDVLTQTCNAEIHAIRSLYPSVEKDIKGDTSGNFENVLVALLKGKRQEITFIDDDHAARVAHDIYKAGEERMGTNDSRFIEIMTGHSPYFLDRVSHHYQHKYGHPLIKAIEKETSGYYKEALIACVMTPDHYFAYRINQCMKGAGTDDHGLIYCFSVHDRAQLKHIESIYNKKYGSMVKDIRHDTSGNYCKTLCSLLDY